MKDDTHHEIVEDLYVADMIAGLQKRGYIVMSKTRYVEELFKAGKYGQEVLMDELKTCGLLPTIK